MSNRYVVTDQYIELEIKARLFAEAFDYDVVIYQGSFSFYNSPSFRSFSFDVITDTFDRDASRFLLERFMERIKNERWIRKDTVATSQRYTW